MQKLLCNLVAASYYCQWRFNCLEKGVKIILVIPALEIRNAFKYELSERMQSWRSWKYLPPNGRREEVFELSTSCRKHHHCHAKIQDVEGCIWWMTPRWRGVLFQSTWTKWSLFVRRTKRIALSRVFEGHSTLPGKGDDKETPEGATKALEAKNQAIFCRPHRTKSLRITCQLRSRLLQTCKRQ